MNNTDEFYKRIADTLKGLGITRLEGTTEPGGDLRGLRARVGWFDDKVDEHDEKDR